MKKMNKVIFTANAPQPIGPYSQAIVANGMLFMSGQIAIDPQSGKLIEDKIEEQTHRVFKNISAILSEAGLNFGHVVKVSVFLTEIKDFASVNQIYATYFGDNKPAREILQACALPLGAKLEISLIAVL